MSSTRATGLGRQPFLTLPSDGTADGKAVLVASCFALGVSVRELRGAAGVYHFELLRRLRRSVPGMNLDPCGYVARNVPSTRVGMEDWFMP